MPLAIFRSWPSRLGYLDRWCIWAISCRDWTSAIIGGCFGMICVARDCFARRPGPASAQTGQPLALPRAWPMTALMASPEKE
jgi:hypothetical protein